MKSSDLHFKSLREKMGRKNRSKKKVPVVERPAPQRLLEHVLKGWLDWGTERYPSRWWSIPARRLVAVVLVLFSAMLYFVGEPSERLVRKLCGQRDTTPRWVIFLTAMKWPAGQRKGLTLVVLGVLAFSAAVVSCVVVAGAYELMMVIEFLWWGGSSLQ